MPDLKALTLSATSFSTTGAVGDVLATIGETSPALSQPVASDRNFAFFGDSRSEETGEARPAAGTTSGDYTIDSFAAWLLAFCPQIRVGPDANFGIGGQTSSNLVAVPRPGNAAKGIDVLSGKPIDNVVLLVGTNEEPSTQLIRDNMRSILTTLNGKVVFLQNEWPRGRNEAGASQFPSGNPAGLKAYSDFLEPFDYASGQADSRANVVVVNSYDVLLNVASGTAYENLVGVLGDGLHKNEVTGYLIGKQLAAKVDQIHDRSVSFVRLPVAANPLAPTTQERSPFPNPNPFMLGTDGPQFGWTNTPTGAGVPSDMWLRGGANTSGLNVVTSFETDSDGYRVWVVRITGTMGNSGADVLLYQNVGAAALAQAGITPGSSVQLHAKVLLAGATGQLFIDTQTAGQPGYWVRSRAMLGARRNVGGTERLPAEAFTQMLPFRTHETATRAGVTWGEGNDGWQVGVRFTLDIERFPQGSAVDVTVKIGRLGLVKIS